jgi:hypothetical protein
MWFDMHYTLWLGDASIPPRLSKAVLAAFPLRKEDLTSTLDFLVQTHDPSVIPLLRPFLDDQTEDHYSAWAAEMPIGPGGPQLRVCDMTANAILALLGKPPMIAPWSPPYPSFAERNKQIIALENLNWGITER